MPAPGPAFFDVWVVGPVLPPHHDPNKRAELLQRVGALHPVPKLDGAQFVAGARLRLRRGVDQDAALRIVAELQALGASVEVEANRPPDEAILALDQFHEAEPEPHATPQLDEALFAQLQSLDAEGAPQPPVDREAATRAEGSVATARPPAPAPPPSAPEPPVDERRFRPASDEPLPMELELERAPSPLAPSSPSAPPSTSSSEPDEPDAASPPPDEPAWRPIPGRLAQGALRKNPPLRLAIGIVAGLALGWLFAQPYAHRAERHVAELRAQADAERYRPVEEAQARVRALDAEADAAASSSALGMAAVWLVVGAAAFAAWWRLT